MKWLVGIDEAGRGPLAGPVAVGAVLLAADFDWDLIPGVGDSKKVTPPNREAVWRRAKELKREGLLDFQVALIGSKTIDDRGIVHSINFGMKRCLDGLKQRSEFQFAEVTVKLDGALRAPSSFTHQETIIKGDSRELCIGLASILAKVTRDRHMTRLAIKYPAYQFEIHKGYGTKNHRELIKKHGVSAVHRTTFCRNLT